MDNPKPICPINFFKAGGIIKFLQSYSWVKYFWSHAQPRSKTHNKVWIMVKLEKTLFSVDGDTGLFAQEELIAIASATLNSDHIFILGNFDTTTGKIYLSRPLGMTSVTGTWFIRQNNHCTRSCPKIYFVTGFLHLSTFNNSTSEYEFWLCYHGNFSV